MFYFIFSVIIDTFAYLLASVLIDGFRGRYSNPEKFTKKYLAPLAKTHPEWKNK